MVDKNLFLHDLAVVSILKNEGPYLKEWLDYHLMADVDHFYLYDNESPDNQAEVVKPYVDAGLVDYISAPGKHMQMKAYNDAANRFKFQSRYMAFIDGDEFIFPKSNRSVVEVVDEILPNYPDAAGLAVNLHNFGSNGEETADYSRGVLERFTRRAPSDWAPNGMGNAHVSTIANPRMINYLTIPHFAFYFEGVHAINENGGIVPSAFNNPVTDKKIVMNHYSVKSREEYAKKVNRGAADHNTYYMENFLPNDTNEEFDDGILRYRAERAKVYKSPDKSRADEKLLNALMINLSPTLLPTTPLTFYAGKMETFLTCRAVSEYLSKRITNDAPTKFFEEAALTAIFKTLFGGMNFADMRLLIRELPALLRLPYPVVKDLRNAVLQIIPQMMEVMKTSSLWREFMELGYIQDLLKTFKE
ncbi:MAG: glycosyltransferase family 92 protein [Quinella sp. 3Q1]|nr:glycosyltransferase family 92 protein [Quinella sp. 3Q1]MBR3051484.1 glycosyltransferase family 92 protein [Selenomonadaceae bacterium]MBR6888145.1 glycosyltransferase family 92 protein [Selenomonadaceae bacterium]